MHRLSLPYLFIFFLASQWVLAQRPVSGKLLNKWNGEPVSGATIFMKKASVKTTTDAAGQFELIFPNSGEMQVRIEKEGYKSWSGSVSQDAMNTILLRPKGARPFAEGDSAFSQPIAQPIPLIRETAWHPAQLLTGRYAGIEAVRPGGNPNGHWDLRLNGLTTMYGNAEPLVLVDEMPDVPLWSLAPEEVANVEVIDDGEATEKLGIRGAAGGLNNKTSESGEKNWLRYLSSIKLERLARRYKSLSLDEFRAIGLTDYGHETDWTDEISRDALSHRHFLEFGARSQTIRYSASINYSNAEGTLLNSGYEHAGARLKLATGLFENKLKLETHLAGAERKAALSFPETFRYAITFNPTAPVSDGNPATDGFSYEPRFDYFNPVAMLRQNTNETTSSFSSLALRARWQISKHWSASHYSGRFLESSNHGEYYDRNSPFRGMAREGLALINDQKQTNTFTRSSIQFLKELGKWTMKQNIAYEWQRRVWEEVAAEGGGFISDDLSYHNIQLAADFAEGEGKVYSDKRADRRLALAWSLELSRGPVNAAFVFRREGSSRLSPNTRFANYPAARVGAELSRILSVPERLTWEADFQYSITGNLPPEEVRYYAWYGPSSEFYYNGSFIPSIQLLNNPNPALKAELSRQWRAGTTLTDKRLNLSLSLSIFRNKSFDLIRRENVPSPPNLWQWTWMNAGSMKSRGTQVSAKTTQRLSGRLNWTAEFNLSTLHTDLTNLSNDNTYREEFIAFPGAPGACCGNLIRVKEQRPIGEFWGSTFFGIGEFGSWNVSDAEGVIGTGLPDFTYGFTNQFTFGKWDLHFTLRGVAGHQLIHLMRLFYEHGNNGFVPQYNGIKTKYRLTKSQPYAPFSSYFVEKASFLRLQRVVLAYSFPFGKNEASKVRLYLAAENPFTITGYTGTDPELRLSDPGPTDNGGRPSGKPNVLAPGIDRRNLYLPARSFILGAAFEF